MERVKRWINNKLSSHEPTPIKSITYTLISAVFLQLPLLYMDVLRKSVVILSCVLLVAYAIAVVLMVLADTHLLVTGLFSIQVAYLIRDSIFGIMPFMIFVLGACLLFDFARGVKNKKQRRNF